jgi:hypothetical protein
MKKISFFKYCLLAVMAISMVAFTGCKDDDDDDDPPVFVEDGFYLTGPATGTDGFELDAMMFPGREEGEGFSYNLREGMYEKFFYLNAGTFNITEVAGVNRTVWGWDGNGQKTLELDGTNDQILGTVHHGTVTADGTGFNVNTAGLYHVIVDKSTARAFFTRITHWAAIGDATDLGWSGEYKMDPVSVTAEAGSWKGGGMIIRERGGIKFRYNSGWKISVDDLIIFANIGNDNGDWVMGAGTFAHPEEEGEYEVTLNWSLADGWAFTYNKTGTVDPLPEYPESLYMIGNALNMEDSDGDGTPDGWQWNLTDAPMIPVAGNKEHLFWKIVWLYEGGEFKFAPQREWVGDFGKSGDATDGIFAKGGENIPVPGGSGYYMVVVNLDTEEIAVVDPKVYLIGNAVGGDNAWDPANPEVLFTVDNENEVVTITKTLAATPELRMYAWFDAAEGWFTDWWQSEFMIFDGEIEYRGAGGDQARVAVEAGEYTISLKFKDETGTITKN